MDHQKFIKSPRRPIFKKSSEATDGNLVLATCYTLHSSQVCEQSLTDFTPSKVQHPCTILETRSRFQLYMRKAASTNSPLYELFIGNEPTDGRHAKQSPPSFPTYAARNNFVEHQPINKYMGNPLFRETWCLTGWAMCRKQVTGFAEKQRPRTAAMDAVAMAILSALTFLHARSILYSFAKSNRKKCAGEGKQYRKRSLLK